MLVVVMPRTLAFVVGVLAITARIALKAPSLVLTAVRITQGSFVPKVLVAPNVMAWRMWRQECSST